MRLSDTLTADPPQGDYILSPTGLTWNVLRRNDRGAGESISVGNRDKRTARARLLSLAAADQVDGWETAGTGIFWQVIRCRSVPATPRARCE
jgi:hypothetical protein